MIIDCHKIIYRFDDLSRGNLAYLFLLRFKIRENMGRSLPGNGEKLSVLVVYGGRILLLLRDIAYSGREYGEQATMFFLIIY
jgi:hypothetical protein